ncbi:hypothetical protein DKP76_02855 [Falsochrobactrum shanghaiense]|uniref:Carboxyvinyl-carboxyphosphonate phosphorylmutase n=1 Tax=Falsochrobactrum shanghaiense TaxID=2201899 RepID=A0A316JFU8_9HYPH|nr:isocitrate lyase/PEP mutase family protein [Falsochrobactrum shanghaiense]PWL19499.1 hypothetical protein DKP76_02855 [Falsochrobactrum shanghaiense]
MKRATLRSLLGQPEIVFLPGGGGPLDMLLIEQAGYKGAYLSGYSVAAQRYGLPDIGLIAFKEMLEAVEAVCRVSALPIIVDGDTGYGGILNVRQTIREFEAAGAAAVSIEDQCWPKRCGHMQNKMIEPIATSIGKIEAAVQARRSDDLMIVARTDARDVLGLDEAIRRCKAYKAAGADMVSLHSPQSIEDLKVLLGEIEGPHTITIGEGEFTDGIEVSDLFSMGFEFASLASSSLRTYVSAVSTMLGNVRKNGHVRDIARSAVSLDALNDIVGLKALQEFEDNIAMRENVVG